jgi:hypothetical protein
MLDAKIAEVGMYSDGYGLARFDKKTLQFKRELTQ